ncbi:SDR family oxidoreductase [Paractinoplanes deccanensis]|nr:NAD(P)H-binding protein [Actinoplanes deccanensis]
MTVLVVGATGSVGAHTTSALLARGADVRALVRGADRAAALPDGVTPVLGDLRDEAAVTAALTGVTAALYTTPHDPDEERLAEIFASACERLGVRLVFCGVYAGGLLRVIYEMFLPHYRGKVRIGARMRRSPVCDVVLAPTNFYQNDEIVKSDILGGRYPLPAHPRGVNRVDLRDVGEVLARALTDPTFPAVTGTLAGPASISGREAAETWAAELGRPVEYQDAESTWFAALARGLSGQKLQDFRKTYRLLSRVPVPTKPRDVEMITRLLGHPPRPYADYVHDTAAEWAVEA